MEKYLSNQISQEKTNPACIRLHLPDYQLCHEIDPQSALLLIRLQYLSGHCGQTHGYPWLSPGGNTGWDLPTNGDTVPVGLDFTHQPRKRVSRPRRVLNLLYQSKWNPMPLMPLVVSVMNGKN